MKNKKIAVSCTGLILLAVLNMFLFKKSLEKAIDLMDVCVAAYDIDPRVQITEEMITTESGQKYKE